jgi:vesicle-fusing ATPase
MMTGTSDGIALGSQALAQVAAQTAAAAAAAAAEGIVSSPTANGASQIATEEGPLVLRPDLLASVYALFDLRAATELQRKRGFTSALSGEEGSDGSMPRRVLDGVSNPAALDDFVGGLDEQVSTIARRVLATRNLDPTLAQQLGVTNVRGLLLYGPPGCGKTLLARQLALALDAVDCKVVSGPEVLNKFVGTSEERVRELFAGAEHDWQARGAASGLHVVILDELDAICRERGSLAGDSSGVRDSVVNQLLAKLDGVHNAGNLLVVGLTNRRDLIDDAMLRPGRLEVHVEVAWPDAHGRRQILDVHTKAMLRHGLLNRRAWEGDLDVGANSGGSSSSSGSGSSTKSGGTSGSTGIAQRLVEGTAWWSGAELAGLVRTAVSHAVARHLESSGDDVIDSTVATAATASPTAAAATAAANNNNNHQGSGAATSATAEVLPADFELGLSELQVQLAPVLQRRKQQAKASRQEAEAKALRLKRRDELTSSRAVSGSGQWTVRELLQSVELEGEYGSALVHDHDVTWSELLGMSDAQLKECGVLKVGHRLRIIAAVAAAVKDEQQQE